MTTNTSPRTPINPPATIALTGATGFVGRYLVRELLSRGYVVRALIRDREKARAVLPANAGSGKLSFVQGSMSDQNKVEELLTGAHACINLIGIIREVRDAKTNQAVTFKKSHVETTRSLVSTCTSRGVHRYIQMSALGVSPNGVSEYQRTKFEAETIVRLSTLDWTIMRPGLIHGPDGEFIQMMRAILRGEIPPYLFAPYFTRGVEDTRVPLGGISRVDPKVQPIAVQDCVKAFANALTNEATIGEVYNLVGSEVLDWPSLLRYMRDEMGAEKIEPFGLPAEIAAIGATVAAKIGLGPAVPFDAGMALMGAQDSTATLEKCRADLKVDPAAFREVFKKYARAL